MKQLDMLGELLGVVLAPADDTLSMSGMAWEVSGTLFRSWMLPLMGVVIALIDHTSIIHLPELFTYPNKVLVAVGHRDSDKRESTHCIGGEQLVCVLFVAVLPALFFM